MADDAGAFTPSRGVPPYVSGLTFAFNAERSRFNSTAPSLVFSDEEGALQIPEKRLGGALDGLQAHVAREAVAHHHIEGPARRSPPSQLPANSGTSRESAS